MSNSGAPVAVTPAPGPAKPADTVANAPVSPAQLISGRVAIASYYNFSNTDADDILKMKYTVAFNARNIANSRLSAETYINFIHDNQHWSEIQDNVFNGLKIYSLALNYDFNENTRLLFGRKINPRLSSMGAIDGLQFEKKFGAFSVGAVAGSRPDYQDYSYNFSLFQAGAYLSHDYVKGSKTMQNSIAFVQQMNDWKTDRRFIYYQHTNTLIKNLFFMGTVEMDLYEKIDSVQANTFRLSNLYLSLRYRVIKQLSFTVSYNARQNIIYFETYKNIIEQYLDDETLQGFRFQVNASPFRNFSVGATAGYRYRPQDPNPTKNLYVYATYCRVPLIEASATASVTILETAYQSGKIYSAGLSKDFAKGRLNAGVNYRFVTYDFFNTENTLDQNMAEVNFMWRIMKKLSCSVYYEGTFEKMNNFNRIYVNLTQRF
jgi:hypothetical protein